MKSVFSMLVAALGLATMATACAAPENKDSPFEVRGAVFLNGALGTVVFYSLDGYVSVGVAVTGLPSSQGPFTYSVQSKRTEEGGCASLNNVFNPYCGTSDARTPAEKQVGDLSGKHGLISGTSEFEVYDDRFLSLNSKNRAYMGDLSVVITNARGRNVACADIEDILSPLTGEKAKAAAPAQKLDMPEKVKALLI